MASTIIPLGKVGLTLDRDGWSQSKHYDRLVMLMHNGLGYVSIKANVGRQPSPSSTFWMQITERGESLYQMMVREGLFVGTEAEFLAQYQSVLNAATTAASNANAAAAQAVEGELDRTAAEQARQTAEQSRQSAESSRQSAETARQSAETERQSAETERESAESARNLAEVSRDLNEQSRQSSETERESAETTRETAESARDTAEAARALAESGRESAEESRETQASLDHDTAIVSTTIEYAEGTSKTEAPTTGWQSSIPTVQSGNVLWCRTTLTFGNGTTKVMYSISEIPSVTITDHQDGGASINVGGTPQTPKLAKLSELTELATQVEGTYAKKNGYYESMTVGRAENLVDTKGNGTTQTFVRRTSAGDESISDDGTANIKQIKGNTIVWNQLVNISSFALGNGFTNLTIDTVNKILTASNITTNVYNKEFRLMAFRLTANHKYYLGCYCKSDVDAFFRFYEDGGLTTSRFDSTDTFRYVSEIVTVNNDASNSLRFNFLDFDTEAECNFYIKTPKVIDLTLMFGAGNEPSTVEEFEALFPNDYYEYNAGTLLSMNATAIKTVGFNQFNAMTGKANVLGGYQYQITGTYTSLDIDGTAVTPDANGLFSPSKDGVLTVVGGDNTTCVHLTWSGYRNGEYEPYWEQEKDIPLLTGGLKSVGSTYDEITANQDIQRIGVRAYQSGDEDDTSVLTDKTNTQYVLAEPIVTDYDEPRNLNYKVADFGTEEIVPHGVDDDGVPLSSPFVADIIYSNDFTRELVNLPKNYQSQDSMDAMLTAMGSALGFTWSKTFDTTNNKWNYVVTSNTPES